MYPPLLAARRSQWPCVNHPAEEVIKNAHNDNTLITDPFLNGSSSVSVVLKSCKAVASIVSLSLFHCKIIDLKPNQVSFSSFAILLHLRTASHYQCHTPREVSPYGLCKTTRTPMTEKVSHTGT